MEYTAAITAEATTRATSDSSLTTQINAAVAKADNALAGIVTEAQTRASADNALSTQINYTKF